MSFDVVSRFINVPPDLVVEAASKLDQDCTLDWRTILAVDDIALMVRIRLNQTHFSFDNELYHQIEGSPRGSPISFSVANLIMEQVEETTFRSIYFTVNFYRCYVHEIFVIFES